MRVWGLGFRVSGLRVWGLGFRVSGFRRGPAHEDSVSRARAARLESATQLFASKVSGFGGSGFGV